MAEEKVSSFKMHLTLKVKSKVTVGLAGQHSTTFVEAFSIMRFSDAV